MKPSKPQACGVDGFLQLYKFNFPTLLKPRILRIERITMRMIWIRYALGSSKNFTNGRKRPTNYSNFGCAANSCNSLHLQMHSRNSVLQRTFASFVKFVVKKEQGGKLHLTKKDKEEGMEICGCKFPSLHFSFFHFFIF